MSLATVIVYFVWYLIIISVCDNHPKNDKKYILSCACNMKGVTPCWVKNGTDFYQLEKGHVLKNETGTCHFAGNGRGKSKIATCSGILHPGYDVVLLACGYATTYAENVECSVKKNAMLSTCWCSHYDFCNKAVPPMLKIRQKGNLSTQKIEISTQRSSSTLEISESTTTRVHLASDTTTFSSKESAPQLLGTVSYKNVVLPTAEHHPLFENEPMSSPRPSLFEDDLNSTVEKMMNTTTESVVETNITILAENTTKSNAAESLRREILTIFSLIFVLLKICG